MAEVLAAWLVLYAASFAMVGFVSLILRDATGRAWSNRTLLRASSGVAFILSLAVQLAVALAS